MEKIKRYDGIDAKAISSMKKGGASWCRSEDVDRLEAELELALSCLNEDQLDRITDSVEIVNPFYSSGVMSTISDECEEILKHGKND